MKLNNLLRSFRLLIVALGIMSPLSGHAADAAKLEKDRLEIAIAAWGPTTIPLLAAHEGGYFAKRGLSVGITAVSASAAVQGLISGRVDLYQGGAAAIAGRLGGADIIYIAAPVDRSSLILFGKKDITSFEEFRGKAIATTSPGAFGEIAVRMTAKKYNLEVGKDFKFVFHRAPGEALATFLVGNADGLVITPPQTEMAKQKGYPAVIDYHKDGLKIIGPGMAVMREFAQKHQNLLKAYMMGYLDGLRRAIDDEPFAIKLNAKYAKLSDAKILKENYQQGLAVWNKDMSVDIGAIRNVLENSADPRAKSADARQFYDNSLIEAVNREHAAKLFPGEVK